MKRQINPGKLPPGQTNGSKIVPYSTGRDTAAARLSRRLREAVASGSTVGVESDRPVMHLEWCGYDNKDGKPLYLPRLTDADVVRVAHAAGLAVSVTSDGLRATCPGHQNHQSRLALADCRLVDRFGVPRLICPNFGCAHSVQAVNDTMARAVVGAAFFRQLGTGMRRQ